MSTHNYIDLARRYVEYSNQHDLSLILPLLHESATYHSSHVGKFEGRDHIHEMMTEFFKCFPDVNWQTTTFQTAADNSVEFAFTMHTANSETGEQIERRGLERIEYMASGLIKHIEVVIEVQNEY